MNAKPGEKVLRIGIIQGGKIVEERLLRKRQKVTIGLSPRNTFVLPLGTQNKSHVLFDVQGAAYELTFTDEMDGRIAVNGSVLDFKGLRDKGLARRKGAEWRLPLQQDARGKVILGDVTVLFQFVVPPPTPAPPKLPAVARGGWVKSVDWVYTAIIAAVGVADLAFIGYMKTLEIKKEPPKLENLDARFARLLVPELVKQPEQPKTPTGPATKATTEVAKKGADEGPKKPARKPPRANGEDSVAKAKSDARGMADIKEKVGKTGLLGVLASAEGSGTTDKAVADVFQEGGIDRDLDSSFKKAESLGVAQTSLARGRAPKGGGGEGVGSTETLDENKVAGVGGGSGRGRVKRVKVERQEERKLPKASLGLGRAEVEGGEVDAEVVVKAISRRRSAILDCYERALKRNPDLKGKVTIKFTIGPTGAVVEISAPGNTTGDSEVAACIVSRVRGFRFPKPKPEGSSVTVEYPFILQSKS
jgi:outer membrane biosynthesis protein TonB